MKRQNGTHGDNHNVVVEGSEEVSRASLLVSTAVTQTVTSVIAIR
jgi:hypothetical protein